MTTVRSGMIDLLMKTRSPLTPQDIHFLLSQKGLLVNKTTIYREILFLLEQDVIQEIHFSDGKMRYEIARHHHHHIVCVQCKTVKDVILEDDLAEHERKIEKNSRFKILNHSLEFFGLCEKCR